MNRLIADYLKDDLGVFTPILVVLAAATAFFTFSGASVGSEGFLGKAKASVFAVAGAAAIFGFWWVILKVVPRAETLRTKTLTLTITLMGCLVIFWLSSAFNVAGLAGRDALELHLSRYIGNLEDTLDESYKQALMIEGVASDVRMEIARYDVAARNEFEDGVYSGEPGEGAVFFALSSIRGRLEGLLAEVNDFMGTVEKSRDRAHQRLEKIRLIAASSNSHAKRMRDIARESDQLRADLARMDVMNLADSVRRTLDAMPREVSLRESFSKNPVVARRQKAALKRVGDDIDESAIVLGAFIEKVTASPPAGVHAFEKISAVRAMVLYWKNYVPFWAGGVALDIAPLPLVVFLLIAMGIQSPQQRSITRSLNMTVEEVLRAKMNGDAQRLLGLDKEGLDDINNDIHGRKKPGKKDTRQRKNPGEPDEQDDSEEDDQ